MLTNGLQQERQSVAVGGKSRVHGMSPSSCGHDCMEPTAPTTGPIADNWPWAYQADPDVTGSLTPHGSRVLAIRTVSIYR
ncbi:hypothetical protein GCM10009801_16230 [Streptomyces albiaxialis]|uniref:Uncharacterized protein n=1 Tax=Streptomyces albiaxialis TaxID=329523 RepID=A0ABN2VP04_9ACTN